MSSPSLDVRWVQRFSNFKKALLRLESGVKLSQERSLSILEAQGLIKAFEFTHELAWKVMKDYIEYQGSDDMMGSRDVTREAFKIGLVSDGDHWMEMIKDRNQTVHTYNEEVAKDIVDHINNFYYILFKAFEEKMEMLKVRE